MTKHIIIILIFCSLNIFSQSLFDGTNGSGKENEPYRIHTKSHLHELADSVNAGNDFYGQYFIVMNNINEPITKTIGYYGYNSQSIDNRPFRGNFNGNNYKIKLNIDSENNWGTGLFVFIVNATIINVVTMGNVKGKNNTGSIVGDATFCHIFNCLNFAKVEGKNFTGGIIGFLMDSCRVSYCLNMGIVVGSNCTGGIVGHSGDNIYNGNNNNIISDSKNAGYIKGSYAVSGIVGHSGRYWDSSNTIIFNSINAGIIESQTENTNAGITSYAD